MKSRLSIVLLLLAPLLSAVTGCSGSSDEVLIPENPAPPPGVQALQTDSMG